MGSNHTVIKYQRLGPISFWIINNTNKSNNDEEDKRHKTKKEDVNLYPSSMVMRWVQER